MSIEDVTIKKMSHITQLTFINLEYANKNKIKSQKRITKYYKYKNNYYNYIDDNHVKRMSFSI